MNTTIPSPPEGQDLATVPMKFEVTPIPVTDFDRAKAFYQQLGWRLDIDLEFAPGVRGVQFTPPARRPPSSSHPPGRRPCSACCWSSTTSRQPAPSWSTAGST